MKYEIFITMPINKHNLVFGCIAQSWIMTVKNRIACHDVWQYRSGRHRNVSTMTCMPNNVASCNSTSTALQLTKVMLTLH